MPLSGFWSWLWGKKSQGAAALEFQLLTRADCHLCETAWKQLRTAQRRYQFRLTVRDVDKDAALRDEHGAHVPVVLVNGKVRFRGVINAVLLERLLRSEPACGEASDG